jgi:hypothetical protein
MYVVCLDCGKRFHYDSELMRMGESTEKPAARKKPKLRYLAAACALPILWLAGKAAWRGMRSVPEKEEKSEHQN